MKFKIIIFSLALLMSLSLVCAFESPVYNIGMNIPSGEQGDIEVDITNPDIEVIITDEPTTPTPETSSSPSGSPSNENPTNNFPDLNPTDNAINLGTGNELGDLTFDEPEDKGFFPRITGAVTGALGTGGTIGALVFVLGILGTVITLRVRKRK